MRLQNFQIVNVATGVNFEIEPLYLNEFKVEDKITPEYNETYAFGKFDPIVSWKSTKRTIVVSFKIITNEFNVIPAIIKSFAIITLPVYSSNNEATYVQSAPLYKLNCFGYFDQYGVIKNLSVLPNYSTKKLIFCQENLNDTVKKDIEFGNVAAIKTQKYSFKELNVSFEFTILHDIVPNLNVPSTLVNWPFTK